MMAEYTSEYSYGGTLLSLNKAILRREVSKRSRREKRAGRKGSS
jgi:hypothetical protein